MTQKLETGKLRIRMYRVGFGDCFLVSVPKKETHEHILVDCGVHSRGNINQMSDVIDDIARETNHKLAVVIASHAHQDHISGFGGFADKWADFEVGEVWMPWLENPKDRKASKLRQKRLALANTLRSHFAAAPGPAIIEDIITNATGVAMNGAAAANGSNASAMELLGSGFHGIAEVRYLKAGEELRNVGGVRGLTARVLAPSTDETFLSRMDPPKSQRFLRLDGDVARMDGAIDPFAAYWRANRNGSGPRLALADEKELEGAAAMPMNELALALDKVLNNTSLVVVLRFGDEVLLFPGDAQWGNWQSWLDDGKEVLADVTFYKVAHHGSHNATPKAAIEGMSSKRFAAMASTQSTPWPSIPEPKLVNAIKAKSGNQYVQSDSIPIKRQGVPNRPIKSVPRKFRKGDFWYDYVV